MAKESKNEFNTTHSHEPQVPVVLDEDGRCLVCVASYAAGELAREIIRRRKVRQVGWRDPATRNLYDMNLQPRDPSKWQAIYVEAE